MLQLLKKLHLKKPSRGEHMEMVITTWALRMSDLCAWHGAYGAYHGLSPECRGNMIQGWTSTSDFLVFLDANC